MRCNVPKTTKIIEPEQRENAIKMLKEGHSWVDTAKETGLTGWQVRIIAKELKGAPPKDAKPARKGTKRTEKPPEAPEDGELKVEQQIEEAFEQGVINALSGEFRRIGGTMTKDALATGLKLFREYATHAKHEGYVNVFDYVRECVEFHTLFHDGLPDMMKEYAGLKAQRKAVRFYIKAAIALNRTPTLAGVLKTMEDEYT